MFAYCVFLVTNTFRHHTVITENKKDAKQNFVEMIE